MLLGVDGSRSYSSPSSLGTMQQSPNHQEYQLPVTHGCVPHWHSPFTAENSLSQSYPASQVVTCSQWLNYIYMRMFISIPCLIWENSIGSRVLQVSLESSAGQLVLCWVLLSSFLSRCISGRVSQQICMQFLKYKSVSENQSKIPYLKLYKSYNCIYNTHTHIHRLLRWYKCWRICCPAQGVQELQFGSLSQKDPLEEEMATHSSILAFPMFFLFIYLTLFSLQ